MKKNGNMTSTLSNRPLPGVIGDRIWTFIKSCVSTLFNGSSNLVTKMQVARMESVLRGMSDEQLENIGVKRCDIQQHAKYLVTYEYDGL